eukprot:jgi/Bigna1/130298/aug1.11_g5006
MTGLLLALLLLAPSSVRTDEISPGDGQNSFAKETNIQMYKEEIKHVRFGEVQKELVAMLEKHTNASKVKAGGDNESPSIGSLEAVELESSESLESLLKFIRNDLKSGDATTVLNSATDIVATANGDGKDQDDSATDIVATANGDGKDQDDSVSSLSSSSSFSQINAKTMHETLRLSQREALKLYQLNEANCEDNLGFGPLSVLCPQTCEICTDPLSLLQRINSLNSEVLHAHALLNRVAAAAAAAAIDDDLGSSNNQAIGSSSGSSTTSRSRLLFRNPKQELRRFAMEIKLRYEKGTLLKPIFDTVASIKDFIEKFSGKDAKEL